VLTRRLRTGEERGAVLVTSVIVLVLMLGICALVVDLGYAWQKRRQVQNTADAAALGGAQDLPSLSSTISSAKSLASTNLPDGTFSWSTCTDDDHLANTASGTQCISFDSSYTRVRVRVPQQRYPTFFGSVLGVDATKTHAAAVARVVGAGFASIVPFAVFSGFTAGLACLKQGPSGHKIATCDDPETGNFYLLDITQYGNSTLRTPQRCGNSFERSRMIDNIAIGADHMFSVYSGTATLDGCGIPGPNTIPPRTGNDLDAFDLGLVHGASTDTSDSAGGRLVRGAYAKTTVLGRELDNKPLWEYIPNETLSNIPTSCQRATFDHLLEVTPAALQQVTMATALETCFADYDAGAYTGVVFAANTDPFGKEVPVDLYDIQLTPRFAYVPQFVQTVPPSGASENLNIAQFRPIFMEDVYAHCSSGCDVDFAPGPWNSGTLGSGSDKATAMTAWLFDPTMLPVGLRGNPAAVGQNTYIQLVK
jgi:Putative Flp pilus-assembly TadE/G-like